MKKIFVSSEANNELRKIFCCTPQMVWKALNYKSDSNLARKIRFVALKELGGLLSEQPDYDIHTYHTECDDFMKQRIGDHIRIILEKGSGRVSVFRDAELIRELDNPTIEEFMELQSDLKYQAMSL